MTLKSLSRNLNTEFKESRFANGQICPHCGSNSVVKNGKLKNSQRYLCRECGKSFNDLTKSVLSSTKLSISTLLSNKTKFLNFKKKYEKAIYLLSRTIIIFHIVLFYLLKKIIHPIMINQI